MRTAAAASASSARSNDRPPRVNGGSRGRPLLLQALPACPAHLVKHEGRDSPSPVLPEVHPMRMLGACQLDMEGTGVQLEKARWLAQIGRKALLGAHLALVVLGKGT